MSTFYIVSSEGPPKSYRAHWSTFDQALADFLRLLHEGKAEDIHLEFSS